MKSRSGFRPARAAAGVLALLLCVGASGCEVVFTTSLLSFLQRDPAGLSPEQQVAWAEQALASGDQEAMAEAYELVKDDPANALLAARLALELSGVPGVMNDVLLNLDTFLDFTDPLDLEAYFDAQAASVDTAYASAAGGHFAAVLAADASLLSGVDMVLGALCLAFAEADPGGFGTLAAAGPTDSFIDDCLAVLPADDPAVEILNQLASMI